MSGPIWETAHGHLVGRCDECRGRCRECGAKLEGRRRSWCSDECVELYMVRSHPSAARRAVLERDAGVCAECHLGTLVLEADLERLAREVCRRWFEERGDQLGYGSTFWLSRQCPRKLYERIRVARQVRLELLGWGHLFRRRSFWDADHVVPRAAGGESIMANLQTLCVGCHSAKTTESRQVAS